MADELSDVRPSILERLLSQSQPELVGRPGKSQSVYQLQESVQRHLEHFLNCRWRFSSWPDSLSELDHSLVAYGIPDFSSSNLADIGDQQDFCRMLERQLKLFEPRFTHVRVELIPDREQSDRKLRFRIEGHVRAFPNPEPVAFDSAVEPERQTITVKRSEA